MQNSIFFLHYYNNYVKIVLGDGMKMIYNIREYETMYQGNKGSEENAVVAIIMKLLNDRKFDSIDDVLKYNGKDLRTFLKNNKKDIVPLHYGSNLNDDDFKNIVGNFKLMVNNKLQIDKENIHVTNFDKKEYVEYNGRVVDNSYSDKPIEKELKDMQLENPNAQSLNAKENTDQMMDELFDEKKIEVEFNDLNNIDREKLNQNEQKIYDAALVQEHLTGEKKEISLEENLTKDEDNNITELKQENNEVVINSGNDSIEENQKTSVAYLTDIDLSNLTTREKDAYLAALNYQIETGEKVRLDLSNDVIITSDDEVKEIITKDGELIVNDERMFGNAKEEQLEKAKVKVLEYPNPYSNYNYDAA